MNNIVIFTRNEYKSIVYSKEKSMPCRRDMENIYLFDDVEFAH